MVTQPQSTTFLLYCLPDAMPSLLSVAVIKQWSKTTEEGKRLLAYTSTSQSIIDSTQGRNLDEGSGAETMEEYCLLTYSKAHIQLPFL